MNVTVIQHVGFEGLGIIQQWIDENEAVITTIEIHQQQQIPETLECDFLIVLGGPMSANDLDSYLETERLIIKKHVDAGKPYLGICLGAQQLAKAYGEDIVSTPKEVGYGPVTNINGDTYEVLHWHGEGFRLPVGAVPLFSSPHWECQAFRLLNAVGLQFHLEMDEAAVESLLQHDAAFLNDSVYPQQAADVRNHPIDPKNKTYLWTLLSKITAT